MAYTCIYGEHVAWYIRNFRVRNTKPIVSAFGHNMLYGKAELERETHSIFFSLTASVNNFKSMNT